MTRPLQAGLKPYFNERKYVTTSLICASVSLPLKGFILPLPFLIELNSSSAESFLMSGSDAALTPSFSRFRDSVFPSFRGSFGNWPCRSLHPKIERSPWNRRCTLPQPEQH